MSIYNKKLVASLVYIIYGLVMYLLINIIQSQTFNNWINISSLMLVILIFLQISIMKKLNLKIFSLIGFFLIFSYLFHFGHLILLSGPLKSMQLGTFEVNIVGEELFKKAIVYCLYIMYILFFGVIIASNDKKHRNVNNYDKVAIWNLNMCRVLGRMIFVFGLPIFIFITYKKISAAFSGNYIDIFEVQSAIPNYLNFMATMVNVGICFLIIGYKDKDKIAKVVIIIGICLQLLNMLSGGRGFSIIAIIMYVYIYYSFVKKISKKNIFILVLTCYIVLTLIASISSIRDKGMSLGEITDTFFIYLTNKNPVITTMNEFGVTLMTPALVIKDIPYNIRPGFGLTYLNAILNLLGINIGQIKIDSFASLLNFDGIGGSFIGEIYYNFMYGGVFVSLIIGFFICKVSIQIENIMLDKTYAKVGYYLPFFFGSIWWIRDSFTYLVRISICGALLIYILKVLVKLILIKYGTIENKV